MNERSSVGFGDDTKTQRERRGGMDEKLFENMTNHLDVAVFLADSEGNIIYANDYLIQHTIMTKAELMHANCNTLFQQGITDSNVFQEVKRKKREIVALQTLRKNITGSQIEYIVKQRPIMDEMGEVSYVVGLICSMEDYATKTREAQGAMDKVQVYAVPKPTQPQRAVLPIYTSLSMEQLFRQADIIASSDATVLILGESGVGKEVLAHYIHGKSNRSSKEMITINCASLNENLLDSELFGYEKGTFTGASTTGKKGLVEMADGSTLFLDEIDSMAPALQSKLLRLLETHEVRPVGGHRSTKVDFRVIAATNANLEQRVEKKLFREDLYYRINVLPLTIPPLRDRREDIPVLSQYFLNRFSQKYSRNLLLSERACAKLASHSWPGNVRELRNLIERLVLITDVSVHEIKEISDSLFGAREQESQGLPLSPPQHFERGHLKAGVPLKQQVAAYEDILLEEAVQTYGSLSKAAKALGISKNTLIRKRKR